MRKRGVRAEAIALSLGGLRRKIEVLMLLPDEPDIVLRLDRGARLERDRRRLKGRAIS